MMKRKYLLLIVFVLGLVACNTDNKKPTVLSTVPVNGDQAVDPSLSELTVTFSEQMMDGNWSWAYTRQGTFPKMTGDPYYVEKGTKNILPVELEPNRHYEVWINSSSFSNFKDKAGNSSEPYRLVFKTR